MEIPEGKQTQKWWKDYIQGLIRTDDKALLRSIVVIGDMQEPVEKALAETVHLNDRGFGKVDAELMTECYFRLKRGENLTPKQLAIARNKMPKYWRQLMLIAKSRPVPPIDMSQFCVRESDGQIAWKVVVM